MNLLFLFKSKIPSITAKSSGTWHPTVMQVAHPLHLQQPKIFWGGFPQSLQVCRWDFGPFSQRCICKLSYWCWMRGPGSHVGTGRSRRSAVPICWKRLHLKLCTELADVRLGCRCKKHILWRSLCQHLKSNLKDQVWVYKSIDCNFILLLFPIASAPLTGGEHFHAQIVHPSVPPLGSVSSWDWSVLSRSWQQFACFCAGVYAPVAMEASGAPEFKYQEGCPNILSNRVYLYLHLCL